MIDIVNKHNLNDGVYKSEQILNLTNNFQNFPNLKRIKNKKDFEINVYGGFPTLKLIFKR